MAENTTGSQGDGSTTQPVNPGNQTTSGVAGGSAGGGLNSPAVVELTADSMVRLPGAKDPVKYGDYYRGFQSEFTKKATEAKRAAEQLAQYKTQLADYQRREAAFNGGSQQATKPENPLATLAGQIKSLTYLSGEDASKVVDSITQQIGRYDAELAKRDQALVLMYKQQQQLAQALQGITQRNTAGDFDRKINGWVRDAGLPEEAKDFARALYLAHEGDDLDQEFPTILQNYWTKVTGSFSAQRARAAQEARNRPFTPTKGGSGSPSKPLEIPANASSKQIADMLFPFISAQSDT